MIDLESVLDVSIDKSSISFEFLKINFWPYSSHMYENGRNDLEEILWPPSYEKKDESSLGWIIKVVENCSKNSVGHWDTHHFDSSSR